jgi:general secretion pathway protein D
MRYGAKVIVVLAALAILGGGIFLPFGGGGVNAQEVSAEDQLILPEESEGQELISAGETDREKVVEQPQEEQKEELFLAEEPEEEKETPEEKIEELIPAGEPEVPQTLNEAVKGVRRPPLRGKRAPVTISPTARHSQIVRPKVISVETPSSAEEAAERYVTIDFDNVNITLFIKYISELTGKNFVIDKAVKGNVTIISPTKISEDEAYKVFESVLEVQGYTTVPSGKIIKIVPSVNARSKSIETGFLSDVVSPSDKVVTQLIPLQYADPDQLKKLLAPLVSKTSVVISYPPSGMLIVTDVLSNIKRLLHIIKEIDIASSLGEEISVVPLQNASATDLSRTLATLFQSSRRTAAAPKGAKVRSLSSSSQIKIIPDERTNMLIVLASTAETSQIKKLIELLDAENQRGEGNIHVYYLQNANAEDLAKVLTALPTKKTDARAKGKAPILSKDLRIVADKATNSLVITAKRADYVILEDVIKKLDIPRRMVYLEALIMEVNVDKSFNLGVEWAGGFSFNQGTGAAFAGSGSGSLVSNSVFALAEGGVPNTQGLSFGVMGDTITIGGQSFPTIGAVVNAYKSDANVHIVSTPQILTTDNKEAEIKVGENVPYITSRNTTSGTSQDYTNYEYKDVGVTLRITPQINQEDVVRLDVFTEVIKLKNPEAVTETPATLKRTASTTVIVRDASTIVIGGIIGDDVNESTYKVPLLGDIPGIGWIFKSHSTKRERRNLYIFITPRIVRNPAEATIIYEEKREDADWHQLKGFGEEEAFKLKVNGEL